MKNALMIALTVFAVGCSKKSENAADKPSSAAPAKPADGTPSTTPPAPPSPTPTPAAAPSGAPQVVSLGCDKIVPQALRDKHFKGGTFTDDTKANLQSGACDVEAPVTPEMKVPPSQKTWKGSIEVTCWDNMPAGVLDSMLTREQGVPDSTKITVGKGGATMATGNSGSIINAFAYDNDSDCKVQTSLPKEIHNEAILGDLVGALPVK